MATAVASPARVPTVLLQGEKSQGRILIGWSGVTCHLDPSLLPGGHGGILAPSGSFAHTGELGQVRQQRKLGLTQLWPPGGGW